MNKEYGWLGFKASCWWHTPVVDGKVSLQTADSPGFPPNILLTTDI